MPDISIEQIVVSLGYAGIFLLMISNGATSFPSSQVLYIIAGYFIFTGDLNLALVISVGALGNTIGNILLYEAARAKGLVYIIKFKLFPETAVQKALIAFHKKGAWFAFIGKLLPAIKVFVPIPAGISKMNRVLFATIMLSASAIWTLPFLSIGYYFGKSSDVFGKYVIVLIVITLVVLFTFYKYMNSEEVMREVENIDEKGG
ncbi:MAG: DedA family protein [Patescibacteria group bacterium]|nr:MAG: DedA family protein [Patescibacteria group bacterium]